MKKVFTFLAIIASTFMYASHLSGGDIQYRYIGDSTGVARHYKVILRLYRDVTGIGLPTTETVTVSSNCYSNISVPVALVPGSGIVSPTLFDCVTASSYTKTLEVYQYVGYVTLPGNCASYRFWYYNCCRPGGITNIAASSGQGFYFDAELDNASQGQNSSPIFVSEPVRAFCVGNSFNWKQTAIEEDGDSVVYSLINCRQNAYPNQVDIPYVTGYTTQQPVSSAYFNINPNTGLINFLPTQTEIDVLSVLVEEYRYDTLWGYWYKVGSASRDMMISISPNCNTIAMQGVQYDNTIYPIDTLTGLPFLKASCFDTTITLKFHIALDCYSVNEQDFRMTGPDGQPRAITAIEANCDVNEETDSLTLHIPFSLGMDGRYFLYSKKGMDGNTLINKCGLPMSEFDTIVVIVDDCPPPPPPDPIGPIDQELEPAPVNPDPKPVVIPNVFTPNRDNVNDLFVIENLMDWQYRELVVMNRWGTVVYENGDYKNEWDGGSLADGVYFGVLYISYKDLIEQYGFDVTILR